MPAEEESDVQVCPFLDIAVGFASAATITTFVGCDGVGTAGTFSASCNDGYFRAGAGIDAPSFVDTRIAPLPPLTFAVSVGVQAISIFPPPGPNPGAGASATFSDDYVFTVYGGTGNGLFCAAVESSHSTGASAGLSFGNTACPAFSQPFTFGVPQIIQIGMGGQAGAGPFGQADASVSIEVIAFSDPMGHPLPNATFTLVSVDLPEPSALSLLSIGLIFFVAARRIS